MILRRDHVVGGALLTIAALVYLLSGDLPAGTLGSPGPGMLPYLSLGLIASFALMLLISAGSSPPFAETQWSDLPHAASLTAAAVLAIALYEKLGFLITMAALISGVLALIERVEIWRAAIYALGITIGTKVLLATLLKSPLPQGPFGF